VSVGGDGYSVPKGGGYNVGRETLRQILLVYYRSIVTGSPLPKSKLIREIVLQKFGVDDILGGVYQLNPSPSATIAPEEEKTLHNIAREKRVSSLPPLVFEAAFGHDDPLALNI
jgi:hypothetical protein